MKINNSTYEQIRDFAIDCHKRVDQSYGGRPYAVHLHAVNRKVEMFAHLIDKDEVNFAKAVAFGHDLLEDIHFLTYNDLKKKFGEEYAEAVFLLTELRGRGRRDRHADLYFHTMKVNPISVFVKLCDILANVEEGGKTDMYANEFPRVKDELGSEALAPYHALIVFIESKL